MFSYYHTVITYFNYSAYRSAEGTGDIRFVSLLDESRNSVTLDRGTEQDAFIGVEGCAI